MHSRRAGILPLLHFWHTNSRRKSDHSCSVTPGSGLGSSSMMDSVRSRMGIGDASIVQVDCGKASEHKHIGGPKDSHLTSIRLIKSCASRIDPVSGASVLPCASSASRTNAHDFSSNGGKMMRGGDGGEMQTPSFFERFSMVDLVSA
jgi:hypothetical protein